MTNREDTTLARVRSLLAKAESSTFEGEAESYNAKASELIARYGIDRAMLAASGTVTDDIATVMIAIDDPYSRDKAHLLSCIAQPMRCRTLLHRFGQRITDVTIFGYQSDLDRVEMLYTSLLLQAATQLKKVRPKQSDYRRESVAAYRRTWLHGFASEVLVRLTKAETSATQAHTSEPGSRSAALVVQTRTEMVTKAYNDEYGSLKSAKRRQLTGSGYRDGRQAGERANLGNGSALTGRAALPSR